MTRKEKDNLSTYLERDGLLRDGAQIVGGFEQTHEASLNETIGRLSWSNQNFAGFTLEVGGEAVLNTLDSGVELFVINTEGQRARIDLPIDSATVSEAR